MVMHIAFVPDCTDGFQKSLGINSPPSLAVISFLRLARTTDDEDP